MPLRDYEHMDLPEGITPDEARWYSQQRQEDIDVAVRRATTHIIRRALVGFLILLAGLVIAFKAQSDDDSAQRARDQAALLERRAIANEQRDAIVTSGRAVSVAGCNRDFITITKVRAVFELSKADARVEHAKGNTTDERYRRAVRFYNDQLDSFPLPDCREAENVVTQDPNATTKVPKPLYQGSPEAKKLKMGG